MEFSTTIQGPDRSWIPSRPQDSDYFSPGTAHGLPHAVRSACRTPLPTGFPERISSDTAWISSDLKGESAQSRYTLVLREDQVLEIEQACRKFSELGLALEHLSPRTFPLPTLGSELVLRAEQLTRGVGFFYLRGLDPLRYSNEANIILYLGISSYIGNKRGRQDELGNMLLHLTDLTSEVDPDNERQAPYSNVGQPFHTDTGDIIALYSLSEAECGGESQLASSATIYNEMAKNKPDMIRILSSPSWAFDRFGQWPPYTIRPILYSDKHEKVLFSFARRPLLGNASSPRSPDIPNLSDSHVEAINFIQSAAEQNHFSVKLQPGDMLFWNNLDLLHSRTGFTDSSDKKRHLLRLWLRNESTETEWQIPEELMLLWNDAFEHAGRPQLWPMEPIRELAYIFNQQRSSGHG